MNIQINDGDGHDGHVAGSHTVYSFHLCLHIASISELRAVRAILATGLIVFKGFSVTTREPEQYLNLVDYIDNDLAGTTISRYNYENDQAGRRRGLSGVGPFVMSLTGWAPVYNDKNSIL